MCVSMGEFYMNHDLMALIFEGYEVFSKTDKTSDYTYGAGVPHPIGCGGGSDFLYRSGCGHGYATGSGFIGFSEPEDILSLGDLLGGGHYYRGARRSGTGGVRGTNCGRLYEGRHPMTYFWSRSE